MNFRLGEVLSPPAIVEQKKYLTFKITPIGGPEELEKWKKAQYAKLGEVEKAHEVLKGQQILKIAGADAPEGQKNWDGKVLLNEKQNWEEKVKIALERRRHYHKPEMLSFSQQDYSFFRDEEEKPTLFARIRKFIEKSLFF